MKNGIKAAFVHFFALVFFIIIALAYFHPVLQGKVIQQSDIQQYTGMAKEQNEFRKDKGEEPYWTNSAFGGMPTYQLGANYPHNYVKQLDRLIRFLPRPADYLFLYFISFYILLCCLKVEYRLAILGALAFGFSTYLIIILGVGHNAKAHAIAYLPMLLGGIILTFRGKYIGGFLLTSVAMALEVSANHYQMTYYFMLLVLVLGVVYLIEAIRNKQLIHYLKTVGILIFAVALGIVTNASNLLATKEYASWSTRGNSELTITPDGTPKEESTGLDKEYITQYSYGITESLNLFVPRLFGGGSVENLGEKSKAYQYLTEQGLSKSRALNFAETIPLYWGKQPSVAAPAYLGAIVFFLFVLGLFLVKGNKKWWLLGGVLLSLVLSWGKNFGLLTDFMIDYFPLYNKFRAVSSIQVILELCVPILAVLALSRILDKETAKEIKMKALKYSFLAVMGLGVLLFLVKGMFSFEGLNDGAYLRYFGEEIMAMIKADREAVYINDLIRSLIFVILGALAIWLFLKNRLNKNIVTIALGLLIVIDLVGVNLRYVNKDDFVRQRQMSEPFAMSEADKAILEDEGVFRVYDPQEGINGARTSYFHQSIGGYHAAKPRAMQDLFDYQIYKNNLQVLNMLNVRYVLQRDEEGRIIAGRNPDALGNAWFIEQLYFVDSADDEMKALDTLQTSKAAVLNEETFPILNLQREFSKDSLAGIFLTDYAPNHLVYSSTNPDDGFAVFSEMYYPDGWQAYIDGKEVPHYRADYALRALPVPAGKHQIEFKFVPEVVKQGSQISLAGSILLALLALGGLVYALRKRKTAPEEE